MVRKKSGEVDALGVYFVRDVRGFWVGISHVEADDIRKTYLDKEEDLVAFVGVSGRWNGTRAKTLLAAYLVHFDHQQDSFRSLLESLCLRFFERGRSPRYYRWNSPAVEETVNKGCKTWMRPLEDAEATVLIFKSLLSSKEPGSMSLQYLLRDLFRRSFKAGRSLANSKRRRVSAAK